MEVILFGPTVYNPDMLSIHIATLDDMALALNTTVGNISLCTFQQACLVSELYGFICSSRMAPHPGQPSSAGGFFH